MKIYFIRLIVVAFTLCIIGCGKKIPLKLLNLPTENISFPKFKEIDFQYLPDKYVKTKKYIDLEMNKDQNYVGIVSKVYINNGRIYILDKRKRRIAIYDTTGKFLAKIARVRKDYVNIADFDVDSQGTIYIADPKMHTLLLYTNYTLAATKPVPFDVDIIKTLNNNTLLLGLSSWNKRANTGDELIQTGTNFGSQSILLQYDEFVDNESWISDYRFLQTNESIFYSRPIENNVYVFTTTGVPLKTYHFDFGAMNVPDNDKTDLKNTLPRFDNYRLLMDFSAVTKNYAFGKIWDRRKIRFYFIDRVNNLLYLQDISKPNELKNAADFDGTTLVATINPGEYDKDSFKTLPESAKAHLEKGGIVLACYTLR